jgi:hypothetical protein
MLFTRNVNGKHLILRNEDVSESFLRHFRFSRRDGSFANQDYATLVDHLADLGIIGGATYDALILHAAVLANVDQIVTLNEKDFRRVYPSLSDKIVSP